MTDDCDKEEFIFSGDKHSDAEKEERKKEFPNDNCGLIYLDNSFFYEKKENM